MKGIILAGGAGTRLHPATAVISKNAYGQYLRRLLNEGRER